MITKKKVLNFINSKNYKPMIQKELYKSLGLKTKKEKKELRKILTELIKEEKYIKTAKEDIDQLQKITSLEQLNLQEMVP